MLHPPSDPSRVPLFGGMTDEETAEALDIGLRTVKRGWARAKGWLYRQIAGDDVPERPSAA